MRLLVTFSLAYPWQSLTTLFALVIAGVMEGLSIFTLLPLLSTAVGQEFKIRSSPSIPPEGNEPNSTEWITEILVGLGLTPTIGVFLMVIVIGIVFKSVFLLLAKKQVGYVVAHVATDLRLNLIRTLLTTQWEYYIRQPAGVLVNAVATEATRASSAYLYGANVAAILIQVLVYLCVTFLISWKATLAALITCLGLLYVLKRLVNMARRAGKRQTKLLKSLLARMSDGLQVVKPLKAMARENLFWSPAGIRYDSVESSSQTSSFESGGPASLS